MTPAQMLARAAAFNIQLPPDQTAAMAPAQAPAPATGGFDIQSAIRQLAAMQQPMEQKKKIPAWAKILGVLGDSYSEVHGRPGAFIPTMQANNSAVDERNFAREKLNAQLAQDQISLMAQLQKQPQFLEDLQAWQGMTPEQQHAFLTYKDATSPNTVATPQGTQIVPRTQTKTINGKTYYNVGGDWYEETN